MFEALIRRGVLMTVIVLIVGVLGVAAALRIPVQMIPDLEVRTVTVRTSWPGATPQDVEKEILIEQEEYLRTIPNLRRFIARAANGSAEIEMEFPFGVDITETLIKVNNALNQVPSYPVNVDEPRIFATSFSQNSFMYFRIAPLPGNPRGLDMPMMRDFIEDRVRTRLSGVADVAQIEVRGSAERQIRILLDPERLAQRDLGVVDVRDAIRARNQDISAGELDSGKRRYLLRTVGRFDEVEEIETLIIARRGDSVIRLQDVGRVVLDHFELSDLSRVNTQPVISLAVRRVTGSNVIAIKQAVMAEVEAINEEVLKPAGMLLEHTADDVVYVQASIVNVWKNLALGALFATLVMYAFLRSARATLIGVMGIPICTIAAFLGLLLAGRTINVISLAGVAFAIGMTLDNSIVVLESIELERRRGLDRLRSAIAGVEKVWPAVLASTLTTVLVFAPVLFIEEEAGQLYSDIAIAISASILASMLVAITVIPTAAARMRFHAEDGDGDETARGNELRSGDAGSNGEGAGGNGATLDANPPPGKRPETQVGKGSKQGLRGRVLASVDALIRTPLRRAATIGVTVLASAAIVIGLTPPAAYLPEGEEAKTFARMNAPPGYNLEQMAEIGHQLEQQLMPYVDADPTAFERGEDPVPAMQYLNMGIDPQGIRIITESVDPTQIDELMDALREAYEQFPGMRTFVSRGSIITSNEGGTRSVNLDITGPRLAAIYEVALAAYRRAEEVFDDPRIQANPSTLSLAQPLIEVRPDWDRANEVGMSAADLGYTVAALTDGAFADEFFLADDKIDIFLYSRAGTEAEVATLGSLPVYTPIGSVLPLAALADIVETVDTSMIRRVDGRRAVTLNIIPPETVALETGVEIVQRDVLGHLQAAGAIPSDVAVEISGANDQLQATQQSLRTNFIVALVIVYLVMVAIFTHWGYPLLIMVTIPLGIAGGIAGLALLNAVGALLPLIGLEAVHQPFDMISMLGFLILLGTVVNNPILI
ncbi:MAG: efflux RND transporter permease subunit, partial [Lamprobacter sp.]|uniref:efflux RND transporter permease subunit n=1 Tax=Lamprobacter sp. TaxID=3100796 RepID=UPI002B25E64A